MSNSNSPSSSTTAIMGAAGRARDYLRFGILLTAFALLSMGVAGILITQLQLTGPLAVLVLALWIVACWAVGQTLRP